jgi:large subunit ribosomal protein L20
MRIKRSVSSRAKHKKILRANKGYRMTKRRLIRPAKQAFLHAGEYAYTGRKLKKRDFRRLWILRISEQVKQNGISYHSFIHELKKQHIDLDRKMLAHLISSNPDAFSAIIKKIHTVN